ncbi:hypothetical protein N0V93_001402 [Gnomoniopsis smithogilvyi]|uniref:Uncharacterized protein n=1 Tax=Gnomoniopsis smithogilvyi TaxID=1191159 RepID=A0A9W8Z3U8_9PEZI|nr:hypothetical protein N0V93_001402 [Gnomoniopsis smithogilvyi]
MSAKQLSYQPLMGLDSKDSESFTDDSSVIDEAMLSRHQYSTGWKRWIPSPVLGVLTALTLLVCFLIVAVITHRQSDQQCARQLSMWSPALDAVEYIQIDFNDAFNSTSIYRGLPTPEREEAWLNLTYKHAIEVPPERLHGLNRSEEDHLLHVPEDVGTGYVALLENMIRMYTWHQAGKYPGIPLGLADDEMKNRIHVDHCFEALRIALMCWGDVTPLLVRLGGAAGARADFETHHKCRNFDKLEDWIEENWTVV